MRVSSEVLGVFWRCSPRVGPKSPKKNDGTRKFVTTCNSYAKLGVAVMRAPVAQLDRASGYEPEGRMFESCRAHHSS
jgi:hypothetical protein